MKETKNEFQKFYRSQSNEKMNEIQSREMKEIKKVKRNEKMIQIEKEKRKISERNIEGKMKEKWKRYTVEGKTKKK